MPACLESCPTTVAVIDLDLGNMGSVLNMLKRIGVAAAPASSPDELTTATHLILPGVGSFEVGARKLAEQGFLEALRELAGVQGRPLLGICLGMQLLGRASEEGQGEGLGLLPAESRKLPSGPTWRVPHMGWNELLVVNERPLLVGITDPRFYFVHSYHVVCDREQDVVATATHGVEFSAAIGAGNVWGVQFHPEKSHRYGLSLLSNFVGLSQSA